MPVISHHLSSPVSRIGGCSGAEGRAMCFGREIPKAHAIGIARDEPHMQATLTGGARGVFA
jgi:hypothetical protein